MEKSYGIEAARAKLGDIADHARDTGQIIPLTRHGRTVAVIGPAEAVRPASGVEVRLYFPYPLPRSTRVLPGIPRRDELFVWDMPLGPDDSMQATWVITHVEWNMDTDGSAGVGVSLEPVDVATEEVPERLARLRKTLAVPDDYCPFHLGAECNPEDHFVNGL